METNALKMSRIDELKTQASLISYQLTVRITPLNKRLEKIDMMVWWDGEEFILNTQSSDQSLGTSLYLDDLTLKHLLAMTDIKLKTFLTGF